MKKSIKELLWMIVVGIFVPMCLIGSAISLIKPAQGTGETRPTQPPILQTLPADTVPENTTVILPEEPFEIPVILNGDTVYMDLEEYVLCVVLGEVPATFDLEALKAQAVVARTYSLKAVLESTRHKGAVCTKSGCCQAYQTPEDYMSRGGTDEGLSRVSEAVLETQGQVLYYDGELITATYFSCSGGYTEDAVAVWGYDVPYLQAVESPGEENAAAYKKEVIYSAEEFEKLLAVRLPGAPKDWFGKVKYTQGGGVASIEIGGVIYRGTTIRKLLKLRSTIFSIRVDGDRIILSTIGYGHRVGMSQYGAEAMALDGANYDEILAHYYKGTKLGLFDGDRT